MWDKNSADILQENKNKNKKKHKSKFAFSDNKTFPTRTNK